MSVAPDPDDSPGRLLVVDDNTASRYVFAQWLRRAGHEVLEAADVYVLPSREEGMSLALLEAMAAGIPVVASDIPGNRLLIDHDRHGLLAPLGSPEHLAAAINRLWDEPQLAERLRAAARERVAAEFSLRRMTAEHLRLFERLIAESSRP